MRNYASQTHSNSHYVQHHIVNTLGWRTLRPLQEASIGPVLSGQHCLLLAPTAGGKTESAIVSIAFPHVR
jgi:ATP-dependent helicase Lhr and Lhr-like helicase